MDKDTDFHAKQELHPTRLPRPVGDATRYVYIAIGVLFLGLGIAGTVLPFIPTTPLLLLTAICFGKSSRRLHDWFLSTRFYRWNLESFVQKRAMTIKTKLALLTAVTVFVGFSFVVMLIMSAPLAPRAILAAVWLCHVLYFGFMVKNIR